MSNINKTRNVVYIKQTSECVEMGRGDVSFLSTEIEEGEWRKTRSFYYDSIRNGDSPKATNYLALTGCRC